MFGVGDVDEYLERVRFAKAKTEASRKIAEELQGGRLTWQEQNFLHKLYKRNFLKITRSEFKRLVDISERVRAEKLAQKQKFYSEETVEA